MANEIAENRNLSRLPTSPGTGLPQLSSTTDVAKLVARCLANYGERKGADMRLLAAEWQASLGAYPAGRLHDALTEHMRRSSYWPTIAHIVEILKEQTPPPGLPRYKREEEGFCREGRTQAEEIAHRAAQVLRWKQEYGFDRLLAPEAERAQPKAASQETTITDALKATPAYKRMAQG